jgi:hypothetical protein
MQSAMRVTAALVAIVLLGPCLQAQARAPFELTGEVHPYHINLLPQFAIGQLVDRDCTALYAPGAYEGCVYFRGEDLWLQASLKARQAVRLRPDAPEVATALVELGNPATHRLRIALEWHPLKGQALDADGYLTLREGQIASFRSPLAPVLASWTGGVRLCFSSMATPERQIGAECSSFDLLDGSSTAAQLEIWRRRGGAALAAFACDLARDAAARMLDADQHSAAGYRIRGIVAELERREQDAIADYAMAVSLLRSDQDRWLTMPDDERSNAAESLEDWLSAMQMAQGHSLLGDGADAWRCVRVAEPDATERQR